MGLMIQTSSTCTYLNLIGQRPNTTSSKVPHPLYSRKLWLLSLSCGSLQLELSSMCYNTCQFLTPRRHFYVQPIDSWQHLSTKETYHKAWRAWKASVQQSGKISLRQFMLSRHLNVHAWSVASCLQIVRLLNTLTAWKTYFPPSVTPNMTHVPQHWQHCHFSSTYGVGWIDVVGCKLNKVMVLPADQCPGLASISIVCYPVSIWRM